MSLVGWASRQLHASVEARGSSAGVLQTYRALRCLGFLSLKPQPSTIFNPEPLSSLSTKTGICCVEAPEHAPISEAVPMGGWAVDVLSVDSLLFTS